MMSQLLLQTLILAMLLLPETKNWDIFSSLIAFLLGNHFCRTVLKSQKCEFDTIRIKFVEI